MRILALLSIAALLFAGCDTAEREQTVPEPDLELPPEEVGEPDGDEPGLEDVDDIVADVAPSVVSIVSGPQAGAGVIYDSDGLVVTNDHVVRGSGTTPVVVFADGTRAQGRVLATAPSADLAVIQVRRDGLPAANFETDLPDVGDIAIAVGNPLGFESSVTAGVVSGLGRELPAGREGLLVDLIQTDAAISPGNSGGALVSTTRDVIGITVAYIPPQAGAVAIGFAIPSYVVVDVVEDLLAEGQVVHPFLGVSAHPLTPQIAERLGVDVAAGAVVTQVVAGSPAADAGIEPGDVITALEDRVVGGLGDLLAAVRRHDPGDVVTVELVRGGEELTREVRLESRGEES